MAAYIPTALPAFTYTGEYETELRADWGWILRLKTSGTLVFTDRSRRIDVFLVGGGGGGGKGGYASDWGAGGGGGGYTLTQTDIRTEAGTAYEITIGEGGSGETDSSAGQKRSYTGGTTAAFGYEAKGGQGGQKEYGGSVLGGAGGSGGGGGRVENASRAGAGGSDGEAGASGTSAGGAGQSSTTAEFGMSGWRLYAGGGGGGGGGVSGVGGAYGPGGAGGEGGGGAGGNAFYYNGDFAGKDGTANTGGGGGGAGSQHGYNNDGYGGELPGGTGGSGIVCIRNNAQDALPVVFNGTWLTQLIYNGTDVTSLIYDGQKLFIRRIEQWLRQMKRRNGHGAGRTGLPVCGQG